MIGKLALNDSKSFFFKLGTYFVINLVTSKQVKIDLISVNPEFRDFS